MISNKTYDVLKFLAQIALPGLGALYFAIAQIWGLAYGEEIVGTITAVDAFLGLLLGITTKQYYNSDAAYDGVVTTELQDDKTLYKLHLDEKDLENLHEKDSISFKVKPQ